MVVIAPLGRTMIGFGLIASAFAWLAGRGLDLTWAGVLFAAFSAYFFRDPEREIGEDPSVMLSPADGTVLSIQREGPAELLTVRIFLAIWNVHVQRAPIAGKVEKITYMKGSFLVASAPHASRNERNVLRLAGPSGFTIVEQIAGFIARRIACYVREGEEVLQGQRLGMIYFGSQVAIHVPGSWTVAVRPGEAVRGGLSVIARRA